MKIGNNYVLLHKSQQDYALTLVLIKRSDIFTHFKVTIPDYALHEISPNMVCMTFIIKII